MSFIVTSKKSQGGVYDFATDPGAGAVGAVALGVYLPNNSIITRFFIDVKTTFLGAGATLEFTMGLAGGKLFNATVIGAFAGGSIINGVDLNANPLGLSPVAIPQVTMNIGLFPITQGKLVFLIEYNEKDL